MTPKRIFKWPEEGLIVELDAPEVIIRRLSPRQQRRADIEWLGIIRRPKGGDIAIGRLKATRSLVEVRGRATTTLRPHIAAAVSSALDEELRGMMRE